MTKERLQTGLAIAAIAGVLVLLVWALSSLHKYDLGMYRHNVQVFLRGGDLYADPRNFVPPPAMLLLLPLVWAGAWVKPLQVVVTLGAVFGAVQFFTRRWGGRERTPLLLAAIVLSFPFMDTMAQGHLGGWTLAGFVLAFAALDAPSGGRQAGLAAAAFALALLKPQAGLFVALSLLALLPWRARLAMLGSYAAQWGYVAAQTGGVWRVTQAWLVQLASHPARYPNLKHDVSVKSIVRHFAGSNWQMLAWGVSAMVVALWLALLWQHRKGALSAEAILLAAVPMGYWFSPYYSNYDLLPVAAVLFVWLAIRHPKIALAFYTLHFVHWMVILTLDYGPGIVQAAPGWILFTALTVAAALRAARQTLNLEL